MDERELIQYVEKLNREIQFRNIGKPMHEKEEQYEIEKVLQGFHRMQRREKIQAFRREHDCEYCLYFERPRKCKAIANCPIEGGNDWEEQKHKKCSRDKEGDCPYGKCVEACIGFCLNDIVKEHRRQWGIRNCKDNYSKGGS